MARVEGGGGGGLGLDDGRGASRASGAVMCASRLATGVRRGAEWAEEAGIGGTQAVRCPERGAVNSPVAGDPGCAEGEQLPGVEKRIVDKREAPWAGPQKRCPL